MNTLPSYPQKKGWSFQWNFLLISLALFSALVFSILSWLELCVEHCSANQDYRLLGLPFAMVGVSFFTLLLALHLLSKRYAFLSRLVGWMVASALGAEAMFIIIQKYEIGHWCPVCLSIAASVAIAALILFMRYLKNFKETLQSHNRGDIMRTLKKGLTSFSFVLFGFLMAFIGVDKHNYAEAAVDDIKEQIAFGNKKSPIEFYFITDWYCPSCKKVEPIIEKIYPRIKSEVRFYFIDYPIHRKSLNYTPYNLAFMINDKTHYFQARHALSVLSDSTESPTDKDVKKFAKKDRLNFKELSFLEIRAGIDYFDTIVEKFDIRATPTVIITNVKNKKVVKLEGRDEIRDEEKLLEAIKQVQ